MSHHEFDSSAETATSGIRTLAEVMGNKPRAGDIDLTLPERTFVAMPVFLE
ncbi:MAG: hypothetical protein OXG41_12170 [Acidimicrobiaceae bacterium]|nr:hypothetical protein [Acidimicrobiaceae bacterium]